MHIDAFYLFTSDHKLVDECLSISRVAVVYCETKQFNNLLYDVCRLNDIQVNIIDNNPNVNTTDVPAGINTLGISFGFSYIFKNSDIAKFTHGIWNIHTGKLPDNRGRHPIMWSFLNNSRHAYLSIHQINSEIDRGFLLAERALQLYVTDDSLSVSTRMRNALNRDFLLEAMANYAENRKKEIGTGTYNPSLVGKFSSVDFSQMDSTYVFNAFRAQKIYGGILYNNRRYGECHYWHPLLKVEDDCTIIECCDGVKLVIR